MNRHEAGLKFREPDISIVNESLWKVKSQTSDQYYNVSKTVELSCYDHCYNKCLTTTCMELSKHLYMWDCPDFNRMCKHIYKIHSYTNSVTSNITVIAVHLTPILILQKHH